MLRKIAHKKKLTKDTLSTMVGCLGGLVLGAATGALTAVSQGNLTREALIAGAAGGAIPVVAGWMHNRGNTDPAYGEP